MGLLSQVSGARSAPRTGFVVEFLRDCSMKHHALLPVCLRMSCPPTCYTRRVQCSAFILAGGNSSRMGRDKAALPFQGRTLLERMRETVNGITTELRIVGPSARFGPDAIADIFPGAGPLAGIHAALRSSRHELNLILAVDLPFIEVGFLQYLLLQAVAADPIVTLPRLHSGWQPLCAVYRKSFVDIAELALRAGRNKVDALFVGIPLRILEPPELEKAGFNAAIFDNLNTPADLLRAEQRV